MTLIQEKIDELKYVSAKCFNTTVFDIEGVKRKGGVSDARKCIALLAKEFYPEVRHTYISNSINKTKGCGEKLVSEARKILNVDKKFKGKVDYVRREIQRCRHKRACLTL